MSEHVIMTPNNIVKEIIMTIITYRKGLQLAFDHLQECNLFNLCRQNLRNFLKILLDKLLHQKLSKIQ